MFDSIRRQLLAWNVLVLATLLIGLGIAIYFITARTLYGEVNRILRDSARETIDTLSRTPGFPRVMPRRGYEGDVFYLSIDLSGNLHENPRACRSTRRRTPRVWHGHWRDAKPSGQ